MGLNAKGPATRRLRGRRAQGGLASAEAPKAAVGEPVGPEAPKGQGAWSLASMWRMRAEGGREARRPGVAWSVVAKVVF